MILGENKNNTIRSKGELNTYFSAGLKRFPNLKFKIIGFTVGDNKVILEYSANLDGKSLVNVVEKFDSLIKNEKELSALLETKYNFG